MLFKTDLLVPPTATVANPATETIKLCEGHISHSFLLFPAGCAGLVWVQIWLNGYQLIPWERGEWLRGDDHIIQDNGRYEIPGEPRLLVIKGYADGAALNHTIQVGVEVTPKQMEEDTTPPEQLLRELGLM